MKRTICWFFTFKVLYQQDTQICDMSPKCLFPFTLFLSHIPSFSPQISTMSMFWTVTPFFSWRWGGSSTHAWMPTYVRILRIPQMIWVWRATVEWYIDRENRRTRRQTCPSATLSATNPTWIDLGANPGLRGEKPATNDLSHGTTTVTLTRASTATIVFKESPSAKLYSYS
jgi:hypothetical protein